LNPIGEIEWQYHQHAPEITPQGTILVFDNGNFRHRPFDQRPDQNYSRAVEYSIDGGAMTVSQVWSYGGPGDEIFFSNALGDVDWLPWTGNVLITDGSRLTPNVPASRWARIVEVTHTTPAQKVFELIVQDAPDSDFSGWRVYRSERLPNLYPPERGTADSPDANRPRANASLPN
jgi:arylsulfate sulfotransferase